MRKLTAKHNQQAHPTEYLVLAKIKGSLFTKIAQFVNKDHAEAFADSIKCFDTFVLKPAEIRPYRVPVDERIYDRTPFYYAGNLVKYRE